MGRGKLRLLRTDGFLRGSWTNPEELLQGRPHGVGPELIAFWREMDAVRRKFTRKDAIWSEKGAVQVQENDAFAVGELLEGGVGRLDSGTERGIRPFSR